MEAMTVDYNTLQEYEISLESTNPSNMQLERSLLNSKVANFSKWGATPNTNALYIIGYSGSGKSSIAKFFKTRLPKTRIIHLDIYIEHFGNSDAIKDHDPEFDQYLKTHGFDVDEWMKMSSLERIKKFQIIDQLTDMIEAYVKDIYNDGYRAIVEGVQMIDETMYPDKSFFVGKPIVIVGTNAFVSFLRGIIRDERPLFDFENMQERIAWYSFISKSLKKFSKMVGATKQSPDIQRFLKST